ncbi:7670_t:CDS:2 [Diversispora eburnea]|uniref:7670_t:CDS:1 n=1 Tax=Diversispora eburnea TaxID=1213867 RepID=A0A9N9BGZ5_9GLOM|nr:7670_t:CDS:2 [Diversispora eburnea]
MSRVKPFPVMILRNKRITRSSSKRNDLLLALNIKGKNIEVQPKDKLYYPLPKVYKGKKNKEINQHIEFKRTYYDKEHEVIEYTLNSAAKGEKNKKTLEKGIFKLAQITDFTSYEEDEIDIENFSDELIKIKAEKFEEISINLLREANNNDKFEEIKSMLESDDEKTICGSDDDCQD